MYEKLIIDDFLIDRKTIADSKLKDSRAGKMAEVLRGNPKDD